MQVSQLSSIRLKKTLQLPVVSQCHFILLKNTADLMWNITLLAASNKTLVTTLDSVSVADIVRSSCIKNHPVILLQKVE